MITIDLELSTPVMGTIDWQLRYEPDFSSNQYTAYLYPFMGDYRDFYVTVYSNYIGIDALIADSASLLSEVQPVVVRVKADRVSTHHAV